MTERHRQAIDNARRLAVLAAQERAESIRQQIAAANTVLVLANTELEQGRGHQANTLLQRMRSVADKVCFHLNEPNHVPSAEAEELHASLEQIESGIRALANRVKAHSLPSPEN